MSTDIRQTISTVHNDEVGHHGLRHLLRPKRRKNMQEHVAIFVISECLICQKQRERDIRMEGEPFTLSSVKPRTLVYVDTNL
jgi:hypothetical protein